jgi:hypothetical protein
MVTRFAANCRDPAPGRQATQRPGAYCTAKEPPDPNPPGHRKARRAMTVGLTLDRRHERTASIGLAFRLYLLANGRVPLVGIQRHPHSDQRADRFLRLRCQARKRRSRPHRQAHRRPQDRRWLGQMYAYDNRTSQLGNSGGTVDGRDGRRARLRSLHASWWTSSRYLR